MIAVLRGKRMKKCIVTAHIEVKQEDLDKITKRLNKQWRDGLMVLPDGFSAKVVDDEWTDVSKCVPMDGQTVLLWYEYHEDEKLCATYGFGWLEDGRWKVCANNVDVILAWMPLPEPYEVNR